MKIVTSFAYLLQLARGAAAARETGDEELIRTAEAAHENYRQMCLASDEMHLGFKWGDL